MADCLFGQSLVTYPSSSSLSATHTIIVACFSTSFFVAAFMPMQLMQPFLLMPARDAAGNALFAFYNRRLRSHCRKMAGTIRSEHDFVHVHSSKSLTDRNAQCPKKTCLK